MQEPKYSIGDKVAFGKSQYIILAISYDIQTIEDYYIEDWYREFVYKCQSLDDNTIVKFFEEYMLENILV